MQRYFFDVAARSYVQYDYHGREIHNLSKRVSWRN